ncbi:MAG: phosphatidylinositol-specific phospholipase C domain-containing protein [Candidatus Heimdallarchaeota archaeon]|nr:phosphatidylinositol-specific phospholipase C domain-containing protein [Candidatus Heimdallarchaeota archaeon]
MNYNLPLNQYHIKASHNTFGIKLFWDNVQRIQNIKEFLNAGFRGLEIDVYHDRKGRTKVAHHGLNLSFSRPSFRDYLKKIEKWRKENPLHLPLIIHIQANHPLEFKGLAEDVFSDVLNVFRNDSLLTPDDVNKFRNDNPGVFWPILNDLKGKLICNTQTETITAYHKQKESGSSDLAKYFFSTADNDFFANYSYRKLKWDSKTNIQNIEKLRNDVKLGKLIRVYPSAKFFLFFRQSVLDVQDCLTWGANLIAVDDRKELTSFLTDPYTPIMN